MTQGEEAEIAGLGRGAEHVMARAIRAGLLLMPRACETRPIARDNEHFNCDVKTPFFVELDEIYCVAGLSLRGPSTLWRVRAARGRACHLLPGR